MDCSRAITLAVLLATLRCIAQQPQVPLLPPSEELKAATAPLLAARAQPDDMTQADLFAFNVGIAHASRACHALEPTQQALTKTPDELLEFASLCSFGQQWESARHAAQLYLELPAPAEREKALLLLGQAFLGLNDPVDAAAQIITSERDYPYDAQIHFAADQVILAGTMFSEASNKSVLGLCNDQLNHTLALLEHGKPLSGNDSIATPGTLFSDAVRCLDIARALKDPSAESTLPRLQNIVHRPDAEPTIEATRMQSALSREEMIEHPTPLKELSGMVVRSTGPLRPLTVDLARPLTILVPFTLWSSSTLAFVRDLQATALRNEIYLITSWAANTGSEDEEAKEIRNALRDTAKSLPPNVTILIVPDVDLQQFHADAFPAVIILREAIVKANMPVVGDAAKRLTVLAMGPFQSVKPHLRPPHTRE